MKVTLKIPVFGWVWLGMPCHTQTTLLHENFAVFGGKIAFRGILISWFRQIDEFRGILILRFEQKMKKVNDLHVLKLCIFTVNCKDFTPCKYTYSS